MKTFNLLIIALPFLLFESCNNHTPQKKKTPFIRPSAVSAANIIAKYKNTLIRKKKISQGAFSYVDTTFESDLFIVTDTVKEIQIDNKGKEYIILGRVKNNENLKCYFKNDKVIDSLKVNQLVTVSSNKHAAVFKSIKLDTIISVFVVEMANCSLISPVKK